MLSFNIELIIFFIVDIISRLINVPYKLAAYFDSATKQAKQFAIAVFKEINKTGEFTIQFKIKRDLHAHTDNDAANNDESIE